MTDALKTAAIWTLFLIVLPPVSAVCWLAVWWFDRGNETD